VRRRPRDQRCQLLNQIVLLIVAVPTLNGVCVVVDNSLVGRERRQNRASALNPVTAAGIVRLIGQPM
jgi:hypothetical protein